LNSALSSLKEVQDGSDSSNEDKRREASLKRGEIYREMHNTEDAIKEYDDVLARHSDDYVTLYLKSLIYMEESKYKLAISLLKSSLKVNPRYRVAKYALRECYGKLYFKRDKQQKK
jgi:tetratricopeptide (TPR) repeat protein